MMREINVNEQCVTDRFAAYHGDCIEVLSSLPDNSVDFGVWSPPFSSLYVYSSSDRDLGNVRNDAEFFAHHDFLVQQLSRVLKPGRLVGMHCMTMPTSKARDGYIGLRDFRGDLIRAFQKHGWIYASEVCIWKCPVNAVTRTKAFGLLHKTLLNDSTNSRMGIPDYVVFMRKPGRNDEPVRHTREEYPVSEWQKVASPVWMDINPSDTLQTKSAREDDDEKHIAPLQLEVIRRCLKLYTNPNDVVLSPFMGIGSEGYVSLQEGRRFVGAELKKSYFDQAVRNLQNAVQISSQGGLFDRMAASASP